MSLDCQGTSLSLDGEGMSHNPGTGPQTGEIGPIGPQRANRGWPGALPKIPENWEIAEKLGFGGVWGETGTSKHLLDTLQSIWVAGFPKIWILGSIPKQNHVFQGSQNLGASLEQLPPANQFWEIGPNLGT